MNDLPAPDSTFYGSGTARSYHSKKQIQEYLQLAVEQAMKEKDAEIARLNKELLDTTWQDHADFWQKRAESAERELDLWKLKWEQLNDDLAEALDELDSLRNKTKTNG